MRHFLSNFHNICSYNICLSCVSGIQIDAIDPLIISVLRQQRKYSSESKNKGSNKERVFRSINSQYMCYVHGLWAKIHIILNSLFKRLMEIFLDNMKLLKFLNKVKLLQLYKYYESIYVTFFFFSYTDFQTTRGLRILSVQSQTNTISLRDASSSVSNSLLLNSFCTYIHDKYKSGCIQTCYVKLRLGITTIEEPQSLHQGLMSTPVLIGTAEYYSYCSHIVSVHFVMDIVSLSTSLLLIPFGFSSFCLSVLSHKD